MKTLALIGVLGAAASLAACQEYGPSAPAASAYATPASAKASYGCFRTYDIRNHTIDGDHTAYIRLTDRSVYRIETNGSCFAGATSSDPLVMRSPPGSTYVCKAIDMDLGVHIGGGPTKHCIVASVTPVAPAQVAALPPKIRP
jgi:hypothetical protein